MQVISKDATIDIPPSVAVCPYCGGKLVAQCEHWSQTDDGSWLAVHLELDCESEPELDDNDDASLERFDEWLAEHTYMPYVHMLPVETKVTAWVNKNYRWNCGV